MTAMLTSDLPLAAADPGQGQIVGDDRVLLLTTDRISAFDVVMAETIPMKGAVLTRSAPGGSGNSKAPCRIT